MTHRNRKRMLPVALLVGISTIWVLALSGSGSAATQVAPTNTSEPRIQGKAQVGMTLTGTQGTWTGNPATFRYQWVHCADSGGRPDGSDCAAIGGATTLRYKLADDDEGNRIRFRVTASNPDGSATAASNATPKVVGDTTPLNTKPPTISGKPIVGSRLTANPGQWTNRPSFAYQWRRCDSDGGSCSGISGAIEQTYDLKAVDAGNTLRVRVTAKTGTETNAATSVPTAVIKPATAPEPTPAPNGCPAGTGTIRADELAAPVRLLVDGQQLSPSVVTSGQRGLTVRFRVSACGGRPVQGALVYTTAVPYNQFTVPSERPTGADGWATLTLSRLQGFPASRSQQLLVMFVRARKATDNPLAGISTRRLVAFPVNLAA